MAFLNKEQLDLIGFEFLGENVQISERAVFYNPSKISIDNNSRIDDFCILSANKEGISIGKYVHIASYCSLQGESKIVMEDFSGLSSRVAIYSSSDDYSGAAMTNPCVPKKYTNVFTGPIIIKKHVIIGVGTCILPNVTIGSGSAVGAFSLVSKNIEDYVIAVGVPAKSKVSRKKDLFRLEQDFLSTKT